MSKTQKVTPRILPGFMELLPGDQIAFNQVFDTIRRVYERFGFAPIETPAIELSEVLFAKGGGDTEKQIYEIARGENSTPQALHFDLTVPLARYVAQHQHDLTFPFRRYQMQKVWRGERQQRGRFREFYQCDIDVIGSYSPTTDAEIPAVIYAVFKELGFGDFAIRLNNRKVLNGFFEAVGATDLSADILRTVDKIDKIGADGVRKLLIEVGASTEVADQILDFVAISGTNEEILDQLTALETRSDLFDEGLAELTKVYRLIQAFKVPVESVAIDLSIARGLDYYTGTVYETILKDHPGIGSICSGGRYDDLAGYYTDAELPGVGISIGLTRLFYQLKEAGLIATAQSTPAKVMVATIGEASQDAALTIGAELRQNEIAALVYYEDRNLKAQLKYASRIGVPFVAIVGEDEIKKGIVTLRDMTAGTQTEVAIAEVASAISRA